MAPTPPAPAATTAAVVQGRALELPMRIDRAVGGLGLFAADAAAVAACLPDGLVPITLPGGRGVVALMLVDYLDNPLGDYDEGVVALAARPAGGPRGSAGSLAASLRGAGAWIAHMPVSQAFTREAGEVLWGYPKTLDELSLDRRGRHGTLTWRAGGREVLRLAVRRGAGLPGVPIPATTYTAKGGVVHATRLVARPARLRVGPGGARVRLGDHPIADRLRALGLRPTALASAWLDDAAMRFEPARPL